MAAQPAALPPLVWSPWAPPRAEVPAATLNATAGSAAAQQATVAGAGSLIPLLYGTQRVGAHIVPAPNYHGKLILLAVWCLGEVDAIVSVEVDDAQKSSSITVTHYTGSDTQGVDPTLRTTFAAAGKVYADTLPGICYSVFSVPAGTSAGFPRLSATIRGMKVASESGGAKAYHDNAAYIIADFIENTRYGMGRAVNWIDVAALAAACDTDCLGERKRILNLVMDQSQTGETWLQVLRDYAGAWIVPEGGTYRLIADTPGSSVMSFDTSNISAKTLKLSKRGTGNMPTVVQVDYTNSTRSPWRTDSVWAYAPGVLEGTVPRRVSRIAKPGITRYSEANRYAIERLNDALLGDLSVTFTAFDQALSLQVGDLVDITHPIGLTAKVFRALKVEPQSPGRWSIAASEYDPEKYSTTVVTGPSVDDTTWPSPANPPSVGSVAAVEEVYQVEVGTYASRIRATWVDVTWPFFRHYRITVTSEGDVIATATLEQGATDYATAAVREGVSYEIAVAVVSTIGAIGASSTAVLTPSGKYLIPGDVPSLSGLEVGGRVFLYWGAAIDLDIWRYEIRYGATGGNWATANVIDVIDGLTYEASGIPAGPWRFYVKAIDSVRQYSPNAKSVDLTVTLDTAAFSLGTKVFDTLGAPTLTSMSSYNVRNAAEIFYASDFGDGLGYGADNTNNAVGTFGDSLVDTPFAHPHTAGTSKYVTQAWDIGTAVTGTFAGSVVYSNISGSATFWLETSPDNSTWTQWPGGSGKTTCRYVRLRLETTGTMLVQSGATAQITSYPRTETGTITATAGVAATVTLGNKYVAANSIQLTPQGNVARQALFDNVVISTTGSNSFDVWLFNAAGVSVGGDVSWQFQGI